MTGATIGFAITDYAVPLLASAATSGAGAAIGTAAIGAGVSRLLAPSAKGINIPPPPGAAMIDPAGAAAAGAIRRRQAVAGGINSTITGAGNAAPLGPTSGSKTLLGS